LGGVVWEVDEADGGWSVVAGAVVFGAFDAVAVVAGAFDDAGVTAVAALGVEVTLGGDGGQDRLSYLFGAVGLVRGERPPSR
jgi:hypothetical protein